MKVDTVNVIEWECDTIQFVHSFTDNEDGNKKAEELFSTLALGHRCPEDDVDSYIEDGHYEKAGYQIFLTHSC